MTAYFFHAQSALIAIWPFSVSVFHHSTQGSWKCFVRFILYGAAQNDSIDGWSGGLIVHKCIYMTGVFDEITIDCAR